MMIYDRCPALERLIGHMRDFPVLRRGNWIVWTSGSWILTFLAFLIPSGLILALTYTPDGHSAFQSVQEIMRRVPAGWFMRFLHQAGVDMIFFALYVHIARGIWHYSYKCPRELVWLSGSALFCLFLITAFAGYSLPWGQMSYWATTVVVNALNDIGATFHVDLARYVFGTDSLRDSPNAAAIVLHRTFVVHFLIGIGCSAFIAWHLVCCHELGNRRSDAGNGCGPTAGAKLSPEEIGKSAKRLPFWPYFALNDLAVVSVLMIIYAGLVFFYPLGEAANLIPADPDKTPAHIRPAWYLVPFFTILKIVPSSLGGIGACLSMLFAFIALPWLDRSTPKTRYRPFIFKMATTLYLAAFVTLGVLGSLDTLFVDGARACLAILLIYPLVFLPLWSRYERNGGFKA